jgi:Cu/Ag efflux protein CusF
MNRPAIIIIAIAAAFAVNAFAQTSVVKSSSESGKASVEHTVDVTATIMAIDNTTRDITLKGPKGNRLVVTAGPEVKNFDQINVGDKVHARYVEALVLELKKGNDLAVARTEEKSAMGAMPGAQPHGVAGRRITVVADVVAVNRETQIVTLQGPQLTAELKVTNPDQLKRIKKGDQVYATYTQALAMVVESIPNK